MLNDASESRTSTPPPGFFPDFFVVGAPRCGTTALCLWLKRNPQVCFSKPKETHYFSKLAPLLPGADLRASYLEPFYWHYQPGVHRAAGEGSVSYLYDEDALRRILAISPDARFLVMVRDPLEMLPSYHALMLYYLEEDVRDFERAWRLQEERAAGRRIPRRCLDPRLLQYATAGRLGEHVERLFELAGRERCLVLLHEDLLSDPRATYLRAVDFIGVEDDGRSDFSRKNESRHYRSAWLHSLVFRPPLLSPEKLARFVTSRTRQRTPGLARRVRRRLMRWNTVPQRPKPLSAALRAEMRAVFEKDIERLGPLLGRDLGHWG